MISILRWLIVHEIVESIDALPREKQQIQKQQNCNNPIMIKSRNVFIGLLRII
jgi:hypothetical protein